MMPPCDFSALFAAYASAVLAKDADALLALYAPDVLQFDMWADWSLDGIAAARVSVQGWFGGLGTESVNVTFAGIRTTQGADVASATAFVTFAAISPGGETLRSMDNRLTWVAARRPDGWRIVHQHTSAPLAENTAAIFHRS